MTRFHDMTRSSKEMVVLSAVLALPPVFLATALIDNPPPRPQAVPAVAGYNEPPAGTSHAKPETLARLFAALRDDARGR